LWHTPNYKDCEKDSAKECCETEGQEKRSFPANTDSMLVKLVMLPRVNVIISEPILEFFFLNSIWPCARNSFVNNSGPIAEAERSAIQATFACCASTEKTRAAAMRLQ